MRPNPPLFCIGCQVRIPNRKDRFTRYCKKCFCESRCKACGQILAKGKEHVCNSIDLRPPRNCQTCGKEMSNLGYERWHRNCGYCNKTAFRERERQERRQLREKFGGCCSKCGYSRCAAALHFHHVDKTEKYIWNVKGKGGASIREIRKHPERFDLLCSNCHIEEHNMVDR